MNKSMQPVPFNILEKFAENQAQEIILRSKELEVRSQTANNAHEFSLKSLDFNKNDRDEIRKYTKSIMRDRYAFLFLIVLLFFTFLVFALYLHQIEIVMEIVKAITYIIIGGLAGYGIASQKLKADQQQ